MLLDSKKLFCFDHKWSFFNLNPSFFKSSCKFHKNSFPKNHLQKYFTRFFSFNPPAISHHENSPNFNYNSIHLNLSEKAPPTLNKSAKDHHSASSWLIFQTSIRNRRRKISQPLKYRSDFICKRKSDHNVAFVQYRNIDINISSTSIFGLYVHISLWISAAPYFRFVSLRFRQLFFHASCTNIVANNRHFS